MPVMFPNAVIMSGELFTYGLVVGLLYSLVKKRGTLGIYISLISAMICGRIVWGIAKAVLLGFGGSAFGISAFISGAFLDCIPGIILELILIPLLVSAICRKGYNK